MSTDSRHTLTLEIDRTEPISGRLWEGTGTRNEFVGWLELAKALERAVGLAAAPESRRDPGGRTDPGPG